MQWLFLWGLMRSDCIKWTFLSCIYITYYTIVNRKWVLILFRVLVHGCVRIVLLSIVVSSGVSVCMRRFESRRVDARESRSLTSTNRKLLRIHSVPCGERRNCCQQPPLYHQLLPSCFLRSNKSFCYICPMLSHAHMHPLHTYIPCYLTLLSYHYLKTCCPSRRFSILFHISQVYCTQMNPDTYTNTIINYV